MRSVTSNAQELLDQNMGTELMVLLEIEWVDGASVYYSDQDISGTETRILEIGGFDTSMMLEGSAASQELNIVLDDTDGVLRGIYNDHDTHKRPASVYLLHKGLSLSDKILVFKGELVTPIQWDEAQRSVTFNVLSKLNSKQVGFSMEEGDFPNIPDEALGKAWPLVFGQVCHLPAVKVRAPRRGYLEDGEGIHDFTLQPRMCQAINIQCPSQPTGSYTKLVRGADNNWTAEAKKTIGPDLECVNRRFGEICRLKDLYDQQIAYENEELEIYNGINFPQNETVEIFIDGATFTGCFSGNTFTVRSRKHPEYDTFDHQECREIPSMAYDMLENMPLWQQRQSGTAWTNEPRTINDMCTTNGTWQIAGHGTHFTPNETQEQAFQNCDEALASTPGLAGGPPTSWDYYDNMESADFFWAPAGSEVYIESESEVLYIVSLIPGTVDGVAAYRTAPNGQTYLTEVPEDYYTVYETDYGGYTVVEIGLTKPLNLYNDQWNDQIYVSFTSDVGPNACDIIEWLVNKYTDLSIDSSSFATAKSYLTNYPNNFYLTNRPDVYRLIQDIAYQSRCSVYIRNDIIYIKYLAVEPTSEKTLSEDDILSGSFTEFLSETEDVYTTHNISWKKSGAAVREDQDNERKIILKYNVDKYGTVEESWNYYTYNIYELVLKSSTFWLIRKANSWKKVKFKLPIKYIDLDVGDCITLNVGQFSNDQVKVIIESMNLDIDSYTIDMVCWTPIRSGETEEYFWAWPSQQNRFQRWPLPGDTHGGGGFNFDVTPPVDHILRGGAHTDDQLIITTGDLHPSDLDDSLPELECELSDYLDFDEVEPEILAKQIAESAARQAMENTIGGGGNPGGDVKTKSIGECNAPNKIYITKLFCRAVGKATALGGSEPGGPCGGPCKESGSGCPCCYGDTWKECIECVSKDSCENLAKWYRARMGDDWFTVGHIYITGVSLETSDETFSEGGGTVVKTGADPDGSAGLGGAASDPYLVWGDPPDDYYDPDNSDGYYGQYDIPPTEEDIC